MTKLCARGKAAAKRKFKVYPSAYANAYASKICAGKIKDPSGTKRKDWGPKKASTGDLMEKRTKLKKEVQKIIDNFPKKKKKKYERSPQSRDKLQPSRSMLIDTTTSAYGDAGKGRPVPKYNNGGMARGTGAAIRGTGFKGVF